MESLKKIFSNAGVRHFVSTVVSVVLSLSLAQYVGPQAAGAIGTAAGQAVEGS